MAKFQTFSFLLRRLIGLVWVDTVENVVLVDNFEVLPDDCLEFSAGGIPGTFKNLIQFLHLHAFKIKEIYSEVILLGILTWVIFVRLTSKI